MKCNKNGLLNHLQVYCVKLPGIYLLMISGILLDFVIQFPFMVICTYENLFRKQAK
ncbi:MAG: hypothetical protein GY850_40765 [bacterium]|nr:hypothetical protein [bacterium]